MRGLAHTAIALTVATFAYSTAHAQVYKCKQPDGSTAFQDHPCAGKGSAIAIRPAAGEATRADPAAAESATEKGKALLDQYERDRRVRSLDYDIDHLERTLIADQQRLDSELATLKRKKEYANNNLAGATWESSISQEMQAITERYRAKAEGDRMRLDDLRKQRAALMQ